MTATPSKAAHARVGESMTIRVTLDAVRPLVWRQLDIRSDLMLPDLHALIQDAMGWQNRHLHMFFTGKDPYGEGQRYEMRESLEEDDDGSGIVEDGVAVGDLLTAVGDSLGYEYDFGDGWSHRVEVQSIGGDVPESACTGGERACPPEDCGGPHGYAELLKAISDPHHCEYQQYREWLGPFDAEKFDLSDANARIDARRGGIELSVRVTAQWPKLSPLFSRAPLEYHRKLAMMLGSVEFNSEAIDPTVATVAMEKLSWFLARVGAEGLTLTAAGYLSPKDVTAIRDELNWGREWIGNSSREVDNQPVHWLRWSAKALGLVRILKGKLLLTRDGKNLVDDPVGLWKRATSRMPLSNQEFEADAGLLLLVSVAAGSDPIERNSMMMESMELAGWSVPVRETGLMQYTARPTLDFLTLIGALTWSIGSADVNPDWGRTFAAHSLIR
ncbi:plasmid pRiA4b ORF-3 family protein [Rhodococcus sp. G-MC3]|uniref:plasmid pRiA4b ORF-3 family protein n=1 Tax=Rhodococcus sp. G-MC3 TaxID=3046209 RepID=UPI0024BB18A8|nr:plasmid pRiA4b ORF-3 family protein [Rhodococcus sp. G-MC3]MDJ0396058.1 plasmid pRiA4b ORF-3 family protein [Rhodococcus sp. G-MC3]